MIDLNPIIGRTAGGYHRHGDNWNGAGVANEAAGSARNVEHFHAAVAGGDGNRSRDKVSADIRIREDAAERGHGETAKCKRDRFVCDIGRERTDVRVEIHGSAGGPAIAIGTGSGPSGLRAVQGAAKGEIAEIFEIKNGV